MKRPRSTGSTFTERLAASNGRGKKATSSPAEPEVGDFHSIEHVEQAPKPQRGFEGRASTDTDEFLTVPEVARILRFTERHVRDLIDEGEIVVHRFGAAVRISRDDFRAYREHCRCPKSPTKNLR